MQDSIDGSNNIAQVKKRFIDHLDPKPGWGLGKELTCWSAKEDAVNKGNYIQLSQFKRSYLSIDIDIEGGAARWIDEDLPEPTIVIINKKNYHCHMLWELISPVYWNNQYNKGKILQHPIKYYQAVKRGLDSVLHGDTSFHGHQVKNPFSQMWHTHFADYTYNLSELAEYAPFVNVNFADQDNDYEGRNDELFNVMRKRSYKKTLIYQYYEDLQQAIVDSCIEYNNTQIPVNWPDKGPLKEREVITIGKNIARWIERHKKDKKFKKFLINRGAMQFTSIRYEKDSNEWKEEVTKRQRLSAEYTNDIQTSNNINKIYETVSVVKKDSSLGKVSIRNIAKISGFSYNTVLKHKYLLYK